MRIIGISGIEPAQDADNRSEFPNQAPENATNQTINQNGYHQNIKWIHVGPSEGRNAFLRHASVQFANTANTMQKTFDEK